METFSRETALLDPWYITGFVEGEGTFTYSRSGRQLALYFAVKLTAADLSLLEAVQAYFGGIGRIYAVRSAAARTTGYFRVCRHDDLVRVVSHFDRYPLRGTKVAAFEVWRQMVHLKRAFRASSRDQLDALAQELSAASPRTRLVSS
ncbi:MAG: hypothetical protein EXR72_14415 [Myxococcales bacterium]|nr:hypothetical protein [Myxococcales bacterium]